MDTEDFDSLMDWCDQLNFQNRDNRHIVPLIKTKMRETFLAYTHALSERAEKVSLGEALHELVGETGVRACIAHSTCAETVALLDEPLARGEFELETCPHYLAFTSEKLAGPEGARYTMVPPLRTEADQEALWDAILAGKL